MKKLLISTLIIVGTFLLSGCSGIRPHTQGDSWSRIQEQGRVIVGLDDTFVPMGFQEKDGSLTGFDVDLARAVFALYDIKVDFQAIDWNMKENELNNQTIDLIWNGYTKTAEREKKVAFSDTYMKNDQVLVSLKKNNITQFSDMQGKILGVQTGSSGYDALMGQPEILKNYIQGEPILYDSFNEGLMDLRAGRIQGLLIDKVYADYYLAQMGTREDYNITTGAFESEDFAVGIRKQDQQLREKINQGLRTLVENGEFARISKKWFGEDVAPDSLR